MNMPQYQQPGYPPQGQPQYAPQAPQGYPPQAPPGYAPQGYPPAPQPQYQQPYAAPQAPPQQPLARGTLSDFYGQPSGGGGPALKFSQIGQSYAGVIARDVTDADIRQQTAFQTGVPLTYRDGSPKLAMIVPILLASGPTPEFPEGIANWWVKGGDRDELLRAMQAAGAQPDADGVYRPRGGDPISVTYTHDKPGRAGMNATKMKAVQYQVGAQAQAPVAPAPQQVAQQAFNQVMPQAPVQQPQLQSPQPPPQNAAPAAVPAGLTPQQAAMVAQLAGQQIPPTQ
jgi:hypothetical protein